MVLDKSNKLYSLTLNERLEITIARVLVKHCNMCLDNDLERVVINLELVKELSKFIKEEYI